MIFLKLLHHCSCWTSKLHIFAALLLLQKLDVNNYKMQTWLKFQKAFEEITTIFF